MTSSPPKWIMSVSKMLTISLYKVFMKSCVDFNAGLNAPELGPPEILLPSGYE